VIARALGRGRLWERVVAGHSGGWAGFGCSGLKAM